MISPYKFRKENQFDFMWPVAVLSATTWLLNNLIRARL